MDSFRMRRSSFSPFGASKEPMIVVEESGNYEEDEQSSSNTPPTQKASLDIDSPVNPYLLSPWRDPRETRKHSLPSQQVTDGITASQVRRLSERGGEGSGPTPREAAFLATLSQAPAPSGRRHSVVTISKVPTTLFGRSRRESVAAVPGNGRVLSGSRRESNASQGPPSTDLLGSIHNLQLDIMDDIVQSRKARMKLWTTSSEKVCEVQTVDEAGSSTSQRYSNRRFSDFIGAALPTIPSYRRASEHPAIVSPCLAAGSAGGPTLSAAGSQRRKKSSTFLGTKSELGVILNNLTSSAIEINKCEEPVTSSSQPSSRTKAAGSGGGASSSTSSTLDPNVGRSTRSNSFDVSLLNNAKQFISDTEDKGAAALAGWFTKRHQPIAKKKTIRSKSTAMAISKDMLDKIQNRDSKENRKVPRSKQNKSSLDANVIGSAIEGFLKKSASTISSSASTTTSTSKGAVPKDSRKKSSASTTAPTTVRSSLNWFGKSDEDDSKDTCDSSLCSTLKDLFVK